ncbi:MAG TPA: hypothetical protein VLA17_15965 [Candidatus Limnocylindria bacterium]|nr:hypothetical protein [Candidatus Limnocylindria bacterium]
MSTIKINHRCTPLCGIEAPPPDRLPKGMAQDVVQRSAKPLTKAWLVTWR